MTPLRAGYESLSQLADLNRDRLLSTAAIAVALLVASGVARLLL
ncbi:hypothetical protein [Celeribacter indicus]|nr:hypothetical protein [Celeribacter indicus]SDW03672.1 hypothetical protein SAMN05443573_101172 [Celeribacter indicus]